MKWEIIEEAYLASDRRTKHRVCAYMCGIDRGFWELSKGQMEVITGILQKGFMRDFVEVKPFLIAPSSNAGVSLGDQ